MEKQQKLLENLRVQLEGLSADSLNSTNKHIRIIRVVINSFDAMLEGCQRYVRLFHDLSQKYAVERTQQGNDKAIAYLVKLEEKNAAENRDRLEFIVRKVCV